MRCWPAICLVPIACPTPGPPPRRDAPAYPGGEAHFIAVDPSDSKRIYVLFGGFGRGGKTWLCFSKDRGVTWTRLRELAGERVRALYFDSGLRAVTESSAFFLNGERWEQSLGPPGGAIPSA